MQYSLISLYVTLLQTAAPVIFKVRESVKFQFQSMTHMILLSLWEEDWKRGGGKAVLFYSAAC